MLREGGEEVETSIHLRKNATSKKGLGWGRTKREGMRENPNLAIRLGLLFKGELAWIHVDGGTSELDDLKFNNLIRAILSALG